MTYQPHQSEDATLKPLAKEWTETCRVCGGYALLRSGDPCFGCGGTGVVKRPADGVPASRGEVK